MQPDATSPDITMLSFLTMDLDTVTVRLEDTEMVIYKALLSAVSPYFERAFNGPFKEADERSISLVDVSERTFRMFLHWVHVQSLQYDTTTAALDLNALLAPDEVSKLTMMGTDNDGAAGENNADDNDDNESDIKSEAGSDDTAKRTAAFDEEVFHMSCGNEDLYQANTTWLQNWKLFSLSMARLFVFADKYSVPQLRDDVLTAFIGQCWKWNWWPEGDPDLVNLIHNNMPASSRLSKFLACSIAWTGFTPSMGDVAHKMRSLQDLSPDLALQVGITYAEKVQSVDDKHEISVYLPDNLPNACPFHDHAVLDKEQCRTRIATRPHIFTAILDACVKDAMTP